MKFHMAGALVFFLAGINALAAGPIGKACEYVFPGSSMDQSLCLISASEQLDAGTPVETIVAEICEEVADGIPENAALPQDCFQKAMPGTAVPADFPKPQKTYCDLAMENIQRSSPSSSVEEAWHCQFLQDGPYDGYQERLDHCLIRWASPKGQIFSMVPYITTFFPEGRPQARIGNKLEFYESSGEETVPSDQLAIHGKLKRDNSKQTVIETTYHQPWNPTFVTTSTLDKASSVMTEEMCTQHLFNCETSSKKTFSCSRIH